MTARFRISATRSKLFMPRGQSLAIAISLAALSGCSSQRDVSLDEFSRWHDAARVQAQAGTVTWSELYKQSFDRLTALPSSIQQDARIENTVMLLSIARKYEANEMNAQQFAAERDHIEMRLQARLR